MADPREAVNYTDIRYDGITHNHDDTIVYNAALAGGSAQVGLAVSLESDHTVTLAGDNEEVEGKLLKVEPGGVCTVQDKGFMTLPGGDSATLTIGAKIVGALGPASAEGYIKAAAAGTAAHHVVSRGRIVDNDVTTAVVVEL